MTPDPHAPPPGRLPGDPRAAVPAAVAAFLRGIERRGAVLAELQSGDAVAGDAALAAAMRAFRAVGPGEPMARWPLRFWTLLVSAPQLRRPVHGYRAEEGADWLARLSPGPRAAILLRLAAGLDEAEAADALAVERPVYRRALRRALPRQPDGRADPATWLRLRTHVHRRIKTLPQDRLANLARLREDALAGVPAVPREHAPAQRPRWLVPLLAAGVLACALGLAATFLWPWWQLRDGEVVTRDLPTEAPAETFDEEAALLMHPDFELLADPEGMAVADELAFLSWLATQPEIEAAREAAMEAEADEDAAATSDGEAVDAPH